jgi:hypothetical protein
MTILFTINGIKNLDLLSMQAFFIASISIFIAWNKQVVLIFIFFDVCIAMILNYNVYNQKTIRDMKTRMAEPELEK